VFTAAAIHDRPVNVLVMVCIVAGAPFGAYGLYSLQLHLERWDHDRHAQD
jgi:hypothetical protein